MTDRQQLIREAFTATTRAIWAHCEGSSTRVRNAFGIAPMLDLPIEIVSNDPMSGVEVRVPRSAEGAASWQPAEATVLAGSASRSGPSSGGCGGVLKFFEPTANATQYLLEHPEVVGAPISIPEAVDAGRIIVGDVLEGQ